MIGNEPDNDDILRPRSKHFPDKPDTSSGKRCGGDSGHQIQGTLVVRYPIWVETIGIIRAPVKEINQQFPEGLIGANPHRISCQFLLSQSICLGYLAFQQ